MRSAGRLGRLCDRLNGRESPEAPVSKTGDFATYLTGQYSHNHHVRANTPPEGGFYKLDSTNTLPVWLRDAANLTLRAQGAARGRAPG